MNKITVYVTGTGKGIGKTQLASYVYESLRDWSPIGVERPQVVVDDGEKKSPVVFRAEAPFSNKPELGEFRGQHHEVYVLQGYESLIGVLEAALDQAQIGKGSERHADGKAFDDQPMQALINLHGLGFALGQAGKKAQEAQRMDSDAAIRELLGAINYLAGAVIHLQKQPRLNAPFKKDVS